MIAAVTNVSRLDWSDWFRGAIGALISGGAASVSSGVAANMLDKQHDLNILALMGTTFLISGIVSLAKFLQTTPVPKLAEEKT
jgi:peptidoglycan/LPS O-acetylase OafA/YrhL